MLNSRHCAVWVHDLLIAGAAYVLALYIRVGTDFSVIPLREGVTAFAIYLIICGSVFFHFGPGQGGGTDANVKRWFSQFPDSKTGQSESMVGGVRVVYVDAEGTFLSGMPGTEPVPLAGYALRGAILEDASGGDVFVKMTGPAAAVAAARPSFDEMVSAAAGSPRWRARSSGTITLVR